MAIDKNISDIKIGDTIEGFNVKYINELPLLSNTMVQLEHEKTGALMIHLKNEDDNNCFGVAFRTTPTDSTGVAHILEHISLCGSKQYPVRDPFFSMIRRSMKTFMNAFTASDWTMYPFSTQNEADFFNLMRVYLDAAFFPLLTETSFKQEGHRCEFAEPESPDSPLTIQGVVYSEMKGAMSSQSHIMHRCMGSALFPTITYKHNSGGDPMEIKKLAYQDLVDFHKRHYHPSNSLFYTYGNIPLEKNLKVINKHVLSKFEKIVVDTNVPDEQRLTKPKEFVFNYPLNKEDDDGEKCQIALGWLTCKIQEPLEILSLQIINLILLGHSGAPLRKKLLESKLGKSLADTTGFEDEIREPYFSIGLQAVAEKNIDKVEDLILATLDEILEQGINPDQIESAIHQIEFDTREISGGHYPYSLNLLFRFFGTWLHGGDPVTAIDFDKTLSELKEKIKQGPFLEEQIRKYIVDNPHRVKVVLKPDIELEKKRELKLKKELEEKKSLMTDSEKQKIIEDAKELKALQEKNEDLSCLPSLKVSDIPKEIKYVYPHQEGLNDLDITFFDRPTNGIVYTNWYFKIDHLPDKQKKWLPILGNLISNTGAGNLSYEELAEQISRYTGGFSSSPTVETHFSDQNNLQEYFIVSSKALNRNQGKMFDLAKLLMGHRDFKETDRVQTLIAQRTNSMINSLLQSGHNYALSLANRNFSQISHIEEIYGGVHQIQFMKDLLFMDKSKLENTIEELKVLFESLLLKDKLSMLIVGEEKIFSETSKYIADFFQTFSKKISKPLPQKPTANTIESNKQFLHEAWFTTTPVSYVAKSHVVANYLHQDGPTLMVMAYLLKSCFLHGEIREKGGAYGAMTSYNGDEGIFSLLSYRDPHFARTLSVFEQACHWLKEGKFSEREINESILQTCSNMDTPVSPAGKAVVEYINKRKGKTKQMREKFRAGVLNCTKDNLIKVANRYFDSKASLAAVTSEDIVKRDKKMMAGQPLDTYQI